MNRVLDYTVLLLGLIVALTAVAGADARSVFTWSGFGSYPGDFGGYQSVGYSVIGQGAYGFQSTPYGVRGGWSERGSSGGFGWDDRGLSQFAVSSRAVRGSYVYTPQGGFGGFAVGTGGVRSGWGGDFVGRAYGYPAGIPYPAGWSGGWGSPAGVWY